MGNAHEPGSVERCEDVREQVGALRAQLLALELSRRDELEALTGLRAVVDAAGEALVACDERGTIVEWNAAACELLGWTRAEIVGEPLLTLVPVTEREAHLTAFARYLATNTPRLRSWRNVPMTARTSSGTLRAVFLSYSVTGELGSRIFSAVVRER